MAASRGSTTMLRQFFSKVQTPSLGFLRSFSSISSSPAQTFALQNSTGIAGTSQIPEPLLCGRGDKKTKKGKRFIGKFGNSRPNREHRIRRIREKWEQPPGTPWPVPGLSVEDYKPVF